MPDAAIYARIYARVSHDEKRRLTVRAAERGQSMSGFVRDCINTLLLEEDPTAPLLDRYDNDRRPRTVKVR